MNKATWKIINLFTQANTYDNALETFINFYNYNKSDLQNDFQKIFFSLAKNYIIKEV